MERVHLLSAEEVKSRWRAALAHEQVLGLEATRNSLLEENNLLKGNISSMQLRIENLEKAAESHIASTGKQLHTSENGDISIEEDAVHKLVEKLSKEKAELVEKVNELNVMLAKRGITEDKSSIINMQSDSQNAASGHIAIVSPSLEQIPSAINMHASGEIQPVETVAISTENAGDNLDANFRTVHPYLPEITRSDEIEQIPLSQNENHYMSSDDNLNPDSRIPLTDAPLIGAPFRLISFFARYVSGADLVNKNDPS
ncbi:hypothetical protein Leryth_010718 [Lithospermum erythrorhizon]|nr:hypothetical protein Leryth_010718 [Lithospermum erythrorhizon]